MTGAMSADWYMLPWCECLPWKCMLISQKINNTHCNLKSSKSCIQHFMKFWGLNSISWGIFFMNTSSQSNYSFSLKQSISSTLLLVLKVERKTSSSCFSSILLRWLMNLACSSEGSAFRLPTTLGGLIAELYNNYVWGHQNWTMRPSILHFHTW